MANSAASGRVRGQTHLWSFTDGPTRGTTYEHTFGDDGKVSWRDASSKGASGSGEDEARPEQAPYAAFDVARDVVAVSYLAASGFTLTVALNFGDHKLVGFASNDKQWFPVRGSFEVAKGKQAAA
jgi:hypothetical protein